MAIYKLGDIAKIKSGGDLPKIFSLNKTKENKFLVLGNGINKKSILGYSSNYQINKNNITISARGTIGYVQWIEKKFTPCIRLIVILGNKNIVLKKYLYYKLLRFKFPYTGAVQKQLTKPMVSKININIPNLKTQKQIIDIIEPLEKIIYTNNKIIKKIEYIIMNLPIKKTLEEDIFKKITTGKLNVNAINENGKYNFYSCSSKIKKTNFNSFKGRYILLSGNGEIYTWWYKGEFDLYQRVYALTEKRSFFTTFLSVKKGLDKIRKRSNGAVIKFIKLSDIKTIKMLNDNYENILKKMFIFQKKLEFLNEKIIILKNKFLNLLVK